MTNINPQDFYDHFPDELDGLGQMEASLFWVNFDDHKVPVAILAHATNLGTTCVYAAVFTDSPVPTMLYMVGLGTIHPNDYESNAAKVAEHYHYVIDDEENCEDD